MARDYRAEVSKKLREMPDAEVVRLWSDLCNLGRGPNEPPWCDVCETFQPKGHKHKRPCETCKCAFDYHDGHDGECTNGAHGWSCDCRRYVSPEKA